MSETIQSKPLPSFIEERLDFHIQDLIEPNEKKNTLFLVNVQRVMPLLCKAMITLHCPITRDYGVNS